MNAQLRLRIHRNQGKKKLKRCQRGTPVVSEKDPTLRRGISARYGFVLPHNALPAGYRSTNCRAWFRRKSADAHPRPSAQPAKGALRGHLRLLLCDAQKSLIAPVPLVFSNCALH
jgi:hypothetical protein